MLLLKCADVVTVCAYVRETEGEQGKEKQLN